MLIFESAKVWFVTGLLIHTDSKAVCLSDAFVTFCIVSLKALVIGNFFILVTRIEQDCDVS